MSKSDTFSVKPWEVMVSSLILGVLVTILYGAALPGSGSGTSRFRGQAASDALQIKTAVIAYETEYGNLPIPPSVKPSADDLILGPAPGTDPSLPPSPETLAFYRGLAGNLNINSGKAVITGINPNGVIYLSLQKSHCDTNGIILTPWKTYFGLKMDSNYDNMLNGLPDRASGKFDETTTDVCAVWSNNDQSFTTPNQRWSCTY